MLPFCLAVLVIANMVLQQNFSVPASADTAATLALMAALVLSAGGALLVAGWQDRHALPRARGQYFFLATYLVLTAIAGACFAIGWPRVDELTRHLDGARLAQVATVALSIAVTEEIVFRRWLLRALCKRMRASLAILLSALLFHAAHFTLLPTALLLGLVLGYVAQRYQSLLVPVLIHLVYDALWLTGKAVTGQSAGPAPFEQLFRATAAVGFYCFALATLLLVLVLAWRDRRAARHRERQGLKACQAGAGTVAACALNPARVE